MTGWSGSPFPRVLPRSAFHISETLAENNGQSRRVSTLVGHPDWIYKEYLKPADRPEIARLDKLISKPSTFGTADVELVNSNTSWPVARVVDDVRTVGVCLPRAPDIFTGDVTGVRRTKRRNLEVDLLALPEAQQQQRGLPPQDISARVMVCSSLVSVAALFERCGMAYLDWSYANAFWSPTQRAAYVIDVDGCSFGQARQIDSPGWSDPLVPKGSMADSAVDRYRVALLVARCLTSERDEQQLLAALQRLGTANPAMAEVGELLVAALTSTQLADRPPLTSLSAALTDAVTRFPAPSSSTSASSTSGTGVTGWRPVGSGRSRTHGATTGPIPAGPRHQQSPPARVPAGSPITGRLPRPPGEPGTPYQPPSNDPASANAAVAKALVICAGAVTLLFIVIVIVLLSQ